MLIDYLVLLIQEDFIEEISNSIAIVAGIILQDRGVLGFAMLN